MRSPTSLALKFSIANMGKSTRGDVAALNPIVVGLFDSTILVGGQKSPPPLPNSSLVIGRATKFGVLKASGMYFL